MNYKEQLVNCAAEYGRKDLPTHALYIIRQVCLQTGDIDQVCEIADLARKLHNDITVPFDYQDGKPRYVEF